MRRALAWVRGSEARRRRIGYVFTLVTVVGSIYALGLLPPDTSLAAVRERGSLRACVPRSYPPLVTQQAAHPGVDVEILQEVTDRLGVELRLQRSSLIGRDLNPRNWRITRAQCEVIAGGVVTTGVTRSFLETTEPYLRTGWAIVVPTEGRDGTLRDARVGFVPSAAAMDRIALTRYLGRVGADVDNLQTRTAAIEALGSGEIDYVVAESLLARQIAAEVDAEVQFLGAELDRYPLGLGLWKGDLTLKRAITAALDELRASGRIDDIVDAYGIAEIQTRCTVCP